MKKLVSVLAIFIIISLFGCGRGSLPSVIITDLVPRRTTVDFSISIEESTKLTKDSTLVRIYNAANKLIVTQAIIEDEALIVDISGKTMRKSELTLEGLLMNTTYTLKAFGTFDKKSKQLFEQKFTTNNLGSIDNKYQLSTASDFENIRDDYYSDAYYVMTNDIDFGEYGLFSPLCNDGVGLGYSFAGNFDGNNHTIKNIAISEATKDYIAFIGSNSGFIQNVNFDNIDIIGNRLLTSTLYVGLVGYNSGTIKNVSINDLSITLDKGGNVYAGGLVGNNVSGTLTNIHINDASIVLDRVAVSGRIGGLVGMNKSNESKKLAVLTDCSVKGNIEIKIAPGALMVGGLTGLDDYESSHLTKTFNSYADCAISVLGSGEVNIGGLVGKAQGEYENCYALGTIDFSSKKLVGTEVINATLNNILSIGGLFGLAMSRDISKMYSNVDINVHVSSTKNTYLGGVYGNGTSGSSINNCFALGNITAIIVVMPDVVNADVFASVFDGTQEMTKLDSAYYDSNVTLMIDSIDTTNDSIQIDSIRSATYSVVSEIVYLANPENYPGAIIYVTPVGIYYRYPIAQNIFAMDKNVGYITTTIGFSNDIWDISGEGENLRIILK